MLARTASAAGLHLTRPAASLAASHAARRFCGGPSELPSIEEQITEAADTASTVKHSTIDSIPGYRILRHAGVVAGSTMCAKSEEMSAVEYSDHMMAARAQSIERLDEEAREIGANAIIGLQLATSPVATPSLRNGGHCAEVRWCWCWCWWCGGGAAAAAAAAAGAAAAAAAAAGVRQLLLTPPPLPRCSRTAPRWRW